jgi:hypothetical protein
MDFSQPQVFGLVSIERKCRTAELSDAGLLPGRLPSRITLRMFKGLGERIEFLRGQAKLATEFPPSAYGLFNFPENLLRSPAG